jgi:hypothetical protein
MRIHVAATIFGLAVLAAACGGGGKSGVLPATGGGANPGAPTSSGQTTHSTISLYIPPPARQASRHPLYISSNTQSFGVFVAATPLSSPPSVSQAQIFPVATPSPCVVASAGGYSCTLVVTAPIGEDYFYVAAFAQASPGANAVPISEYIAGPITVSLSPSPGASPLSFSLNAVANSIAVTVPSPDPGNTPNTQVFTVGVASQVLPLGIVAYDASNNIILTDPTTVFAEPVVVTVQPSPPGVGLVLGTSTCASPSPTQAVHRRRNVQFSGGSASVTITCASDLNNVTFGYDGTITPDANDHITDTFTIAADQATPGPTPAHVVLASSMGQVTLNTDTYVNAAWMQTLPSSAPDAGYLAYVADMAPTQWIIGTYDPANGAVSQGVLAGISSPSAWAFAPNGTVWTIDSGGIDCFTSISAAIGGSAENLLNVKPIAPTTGDTLYPTNLVVDSSNNVWYTGYDDVSESPPSYTGYFPGTQGCAAPSVNPPTAQFTLNNDTADYDPYVSLLPNNAGVAVVSSTYYDTNGIYIVNTTGAGTVNPVLTQLSGSVYGVGGAVDGAGNAFAEYSGFGIGADVEVLSPGGSSTTPLLFLPPTPDVSLPSPEPSGLNVFSLSNGVGANRGMYTDTAYHALGLIESIQGSPMPILVSLPNSADAFEGAYSTTGDEYVLDMDGSENLNVVQMLPTTTWSVPNITLNAACSDAALLTILERGDSGPFTVNIPAAAGVTSTQLPNADHDFWLSIPGGSASFTATVTDAHGRTESFAVTSAPNYDTCGAAHRHPPGAPAHHTKPPLSPRA